MRFGSCLFNGQVQKEKERTKKNTLVIMDLCQGNDQEQNKKEQRRTKHDGKLQKITSLRSRRIYIISEMGLYQILSI